MTPRRLALLVVVVLHVARGASAQVHVDPKAQPHVDAALKAYDAKSWDAAIAEFQTAYSIDPNPALLYAIAQAYRFANRCTDALVVYRRYLESHPNASQTTATQNGIALCEQIEKQPDKQPDKQPVPAPAPAPTPAPAPAPAPAPMPAAPAATSISVTATASPAWYRDVVGDSLVAGGAIAIGVGVFSSISASHRETDAAHAQLRSEFVHDLDAATTRKRIAGVAFGVGAALAAGGVYIYIHHARDRSHDVTATSDGRSLLLVGRF